MKLQLGLLYSDGRPATTEHLGDLLGSFSLCSADIRGEIIDGPLIMAYRGDCICPEDDYENQPLSGRDYVLTWDGRLDNRKELADRLDLRDLDHTADPSLVLQAYEVLGERVFNELIGEFVLTLWCRKTKSLMFVRSACGARTLYYVLSKDKVIWSSDFAHLVKVSGADLSVDEDYVLQYLVAQPLAKQTPLRSIAAVPPNRITYFENGVLKFSRQLWDPTHITPVRYRHDEEYEEHSRHELIQAVKARLRAKHTVFAELSGGLDSSTVVLIADRILRERGESTGKLQTLSYVYEVSQTCDERRFIEPVVEKRGFGTLAVHERDQRITTGLNHPIFTGLPNALHCFPGRYETAAALMRESQARVLLTGLGGDHLFWSEPDGGPLIADCLRTGDLIGAHRQALVWGRSMGISYRELIFGRTMPLLIESVLPMRSRYQRPQLPAWISAEHHERLRSSLPDVDGFTSWHEMPSRRAQVFVADQMFRYTGAGFFQEYPDIYVSHPYTHRPLVEFCLGTPLEQFLRQGQTRSLMRRALSGVLPPKIARRASKGLLDEIIVRAVQHEMPLVPDTANWELCKRGYVDSEALGTALHQARLGVSRLPGPLIRLFSLERWVRSLDFIRNWTPSQEGIPLVLGSARV